LGYVDSLDGTCAVLVSSPLTRTANFGRVKIDTIVATSISASLHGTMCKRLKPPANFSEDNTVQKLAIADVASFVAVLGGIGFLA